MQRLPSGLWVPRRRQPLCSMFAVTHLTGLGVAPSGPTDPGASQPLWNSADSSGSYTLTNSDRTCSTSAVGSIRSTVGVDIAFGRYVELSAVQNAGNVAWRFGIANAAKDMATALGQDADGIAIRGSDGNIVLGGSTIGPTGLSAPNAVLMMATINGRVWFGENGSWDGDPAAGTGGYDSGLTGTVYLCFGYNTSGTARGATFQVLASHTYSPPSPSFLAGW